MTPDKACRILAVIAALVVMVVTRSHQQSITSITVPTMQVGTLKAWLDTAKGDIVVQVFDQSLPPGTYVVSYLTNVQPVVRAPIISTVPEVIITNIAPEATHLRVDIQGPIRASNIVHNPPVEHDTEAVRASLLSRYRMDSTNARLPLIESKITKEYTMVIPGATNLGVASLVTVTNALAPKFEPMGCQYCDRTHHWRVIEQFQTEEHTVVPAMIAGRRSYLPVGEVKTNLHGIYTTNYVDHPAVWQKKSMMPLPHPPMPPEPDQIYRAARARNAVLATAKTNAVERREVKENRVKVVP